MTFFNEQPTQYKEEYELLLKIVSSLSKLSSDNENVPYLYYRMMENIFCKAFLAENLSRSDISVDASKDNKGIGLKTFLYKNGSCVEKVAEFNKDRNLFLGQEPLTLVHKIAELRNKRLQVTADLINIESRNLLYHCIARDTSKLMIYETAMDFIDLEKIKLGKTGKSEGTVNFNDGLNEYSFNLSKSTLFKRFNISPIHEIEVTIADDPFEILRQWWVETYSVPLRNPIIDTVVLPLYSYKGGERFVYERSGLNQWNANGRARDLDEVYISVPSAIHQEKPNFFPPRDQPFIMNLPNNQTLSMKICQDGGKALMSNPNKALGQFLLRKVLKIKPDHLITYDDLENSGINSTTILKYQDGSYSMTFNYS